MTRLGGPKGGAQGFSLPAWQHWVHVHPHPLELCSSHLNTPHEHALLAACPQQRPQDTCPHEGPCVARCTRERKARPDCDCCDCWQGDMLCMPLRSAPDACSCTRLLTSACFAAATQYITQPYTTRPANLTNTCQVLDQSRSNKQLMVRQLPTHPSTPPLQAHARHCCQPLAPPPRGDSPEPVLQLLLLPLLQLLLGSDHVPGVAACPLSWCGPTWRRHAAAARWRQQT